MHCDVVESVISVGSTGRHTGITTIRGTSAPAAASAAAAFATSTKFACQFLVFAGSFLLLAGLALVVLDCASATRKTSR